MARLSQASELSNGDCTSASSRQAFGLTADAFRGILAAGVAGRAAPLASPELVERVAASDLSVLIVGETGVGKEVLAARLHAASPRAGRPFVKLNVAALAATLLESELFGHERGAFTGAAERKPGLFEAADGGTLFLDEVGEMPPAVQVKLLRVLEERQVLPVGGVKVRPIDVRFLAATNRDLEVEIARGHFRQDLYFRLDGITLMIPPLRERPGEIALLALELCAVAARRMGRPVPRLSPEALAALERHPWPGNVRELRNVIERACLLCPDEEIRLAELAFTRLEIERTLGGGATAASVPNPSVMDERLGRTLRPVPDPPRAGEAAQVATAPPQEPVVASQAPAAGAGASTLPLRGALAAVRRQRIVDALAESGGNQTEAAARLGIARRTIVAQVKALGIPRPRKG